MNRAAGRGDNLTGAKVLHSTRSARIFRRSALVVMTRSCHFDGGDDSFLLRFECLVMPNNRTSPALIGTSA